jgi:hypothetical protein
MIVTALMLIGSIKGFTQDQPLLINEDLALNSSPILVEELTQKRNFFNTKLTQYKFGDLILKEGKSNMGYTETLKNTTEGFKSVTRSKYAFTFSYKDSLQTTVKAVKEVKKLIQDNETFFSSLFPILGTPIPSVEVKSNELSATISYTNTLSAPWQFKFKKIINNDGTIDFKSSLENGTRSISVEIAKKKVRDTILNSGFGFKENERYLGALYIGDPDKIVWIREDLDPETKLVMGTVMTCLMIEFYRQYVFTSKY